MRNDWVLVLSALLLWQLRGVHADASDLPHVSECSLCSTCHLTKDRDPTARPQPLPDEIWKTPAAELAKDIVPTLSRLRRTEKLPNCTECWGCTTRIDVLQDFRAFGHNFKVEAGASQEWLFYADLPDTHITGKRAIVKVWCVPYEKMTRKYRWKCDNTNIAVRGAQHLMALDKVTAECGLQDVTIRAWLAPVNAVIPGLGLHIYWNGLWMERAEGLSLNQLAYLGRRDLVEDLVISLLQEKLNTTRVVHAAIFDLMISQCDRHAQNVYVNEDGNLKLIDNMNSLRFSWLHCALDSIFLPGTQKNEIARFGGNLVSKRALAKPRRSMNPLILMDYRCFVPGGKLGNQYPASVTQCLRHLSSMPPAEVRQFYGFPDTYMAEHLVTRAADMLAKGFEWTLKRGKPTNLPALRYKWHQPCCKLAHSKKPAGLVCAHPWNATAEFPIGEPLRGGPWQRSYPDPGTFHGDTLWD